MSNEVLLSAIQRLFNECNQGNPDLDKIDVYINKCHCHNIDMNTLFPLRESKMAPLHMACHLGHHEIVERLLDSNNNFKRSVHVNAMSGGYFQRTVLHYACKGNFPLTVRALLQHPGVDVNQVDEYNSTPLVTACYSNRKSVVIELLKHPDIQLTAKDKDGYTPLHIACNNIVYETGIIQMLIGHLEQKYRIAQLNSIDDTHQTPLHIACSRDNYTAVVEILKHATVIDINAIDQFGKTPLCIACSKSHIDNTTASIVKLLLDQPSIRIQIANNDGKIPFDIIQQKLLYDTTTTPKSNHNDQTKRSIMKIIQLFEDYNIRQRWHIYCYLINHID